MCVFESLREIKSRYRRWCAAAFVVGKIMMSSLSTFVWHLCCRKAARRASPPGGLVRVCPNRRQVNPAAAESPHQRGGKQAHQRRFQEGGAPLLPAEGSGAQLLHPTPGGRRRTRRGRPQGAVALGAVARLPGAPRRGDGVAANPVFRAAAMRADASVHVRAVVPARIRLWGAGAEGRQCGRVVSATRRRSDWSRSCPWSGRFGCCLTMLQPAGAQGHMR